MKQELVLDFIISGELPKLPQNFRVTRMSLIHELGIMNGINKKNGVYEILHKDSIYYYFGFGSMGDLEGISIKNILPLSLSLSRIEGLLNENNIRFTSKDELEYRLENDLILFFEDVESDKLKYLKEVIKTKDNLVKKKLLEINPISYDSPSGTSFEDLNK